jgi:DNA-binding NarL/FixJ family response regulator
MSKITIVLVDDHPIVRLGLRAALEEVSEYRIIAETDTGVGAIEIVKRLAPDVLIIDLAIADLNALAVLRELRHSAENTRFIIFSDQIDKATIYAALKDGVSGYLTKNCDPSEIIDAVRVSVAGGRFFGESIAEIVLVDPHSEFSDSTNPDIGMLTVREKEVLKLSAEGNSYTEIAGHLSISPRTVETYRNRLMRKLGLRSVSELIRFATRNGVLSSDK